MFNPLVKQIINKVIKIDKGKPILMRKMEPVEPTGPFTMMEMR